MDNSVKLLAGTSTTSNGSRTDSCTIAHLPQEVLQRLLSYLPRNDIVKASEVCRTWNGVIRGRGFWKRFYSKYQSHIWNELVKRNEIGHADEWMVHLAVSRFQPFGPFGRNLLLNPFGLHGFGGWNILSGDAIVRNERCVETIEPEDDEPLHIPARAPIDLFNLEAPGWTVQKNPRSIISDFPEGLGLTSCFATDGFSCSKDQRIDLWKFGITPPVMRVCAPFTINWSAFVGSPEGYSGFHEMYIRLLNKNGMQIHNAAILQSNSNESHLIPVSSPFRKYSGTLTITPENSDVFLQLRYIYFYHGALAKENAPGPIGPHIYNPSVTIELKRI